MPNDLPAVVKLDSGYTQNTPDKLLNAVALIVYYEQLPKQPDIPKMNSLEERDKFVRAGTNNLKDTPAFKEFVGRIDADKPAINTPDGMIEEMQDQGHIQEGVQGTGHQGFHR